MPPVLVYKLALARAETGDVAGAESLFRDRFFPREEGGMPPERVLAALRIVGARTAARAGQCEAALKQLDALSVVGGGITLDRDSIERAAREPAMQFEIAGVETMCGRESAAREREVALSRAEGQGGPLARAVAADALRTSGETLSSDAVQHLETALDELTATLDDGDAGSPGLVAYTRSRILRVPRSRRRRAAGARGCLRLPGSRLVPPAGAAPPRQSRFRALSPPNASEPPMSHSDA